MRWSGLLLLAVAVVVVAQEDELTLAGPCDPATCLLPDCRCSSIQIPGGLAARDTPQFVTVTFDDAVNIMNILTYRETVYNRRNYNGCPTGTTFYVSHEYTNYQLVNELYNNGFEIALHSITHQTPSLYWRDADVEAYRREIGDQRRQIAHFANIPESTVQGVRIPFLQLGGNSSFVMMQEFGLTYDASWPTVNFIEPGMWPYTLKYASTQDCMIPPCPDASLPGVWVVPMISWRDNQGVPCSMVDGCIFTPPLSDEDGWFEFIVRNFEAHYLGNRAPFGFYVHEWYLNLNPAVRRAFIRFLNMINNMPDVFMVNTNDVLEWVRDPVPLNVYQARPCKNLQRTNCQPVSCGPLMADHNPNSAGYWMAACAACPRVYPWRNNPLGV